MDADPSEDEPPTVDPDEAFALIGHETRVGILRVLATTDRPNRPVAFSEIRDQLDDIDSAHFNYHLNELTGHFLERTDDGYDFRRPGRRVAQAILSGSVTGNPTSELTPVDQRCHHCGGPLEIMYHQERLAIYCTECAGTYLHSNHQAANDDVPDAYGFLGLHDLPPAGMAERTPTEAVEAAHRWSLLDTLSTAADLCPRCAEPFADRVDVCADHDTADGCCERCGYRHAVVYTAHCTNCAYDKRLPLGTVLAADRAVRAFLASNGFDLLDADYEAFSTVFKTYDERVVETDPLEAVFTYAVDGETCAVTVGPGGEVRDVSR